MTNEESERGMDHSGRYNVKGGNHLASTRHHRKRNVKRPLTITENESDDESEDEGVSKKRRKRRHRQRRSSSSNHSPWTGSIALTLCLTHFRLLWIKVCCM